MTSAPTLRSGPATRGLRGPAARGLVAGWAGLAVAELSARLIGSQVTPLEAVGAWVVELSPGGLVRGSIELLGAWDKPVLVVGMVVVLSALYAGLGYVAERAPLLGAAGFVVLAGVGAVAVLTRPDTSPAAGLSLLLGLGANALSWAWTGRRDLEPEEGPGATRRVLLVAAGAAVLGVSSRVVGRQRELVERAREVLRLPATRPAPPAAAQVAALEGVTPWQTPNADFYRIDTVLTPPALDPDQWQLRVHGMVEREVVLDLADLLERQVTEAWITLSCVSNPVGGDLVGTAWWSGVRVADLLAEAGVAAEADAILQTSADGWTCATPLSAVTDDRDALLAVAMNGEPLPVEHGFPVRMVVPGLYGFVSATKWIVDIEVTRFADVTAYWTKRGWSEQAPVRLASRVDLPRAGATVTRDEAGAVSIAGCAWHQHTGVSAVEYSIDAGPWQAARLGETPSADTWVQWSARATLEPGEHTVRVRAVSADGEVQTGEQRAVAPDGATGWDEHRFTVSES
ncbi:molybdopterin-dependent oxidoreductase [Marihabitans asiaticum]|uniref:DMSO/TMAO reductase YedYZ molybdopterin-dependent catalytic subunit n=1 Tax=Marihabitans asiaticum TaxID=415218 RepID=A0A560W709_9MICO|nr:molybdopterin-dependent oxidoreductase [Marihabitans asiaticum]TWD13399.1 DMSO/TMAO reductase YedYZ molybdopterin-dependent catalytic subunit [Marihabitans asiaticum]